MMESAQTPRSALNAWLRALQATKHLDAGTHPTLLSVIAAQAESRGDHIALMGNGEQLTYRELVERSNCYGRWALTHGVGVGGVVCLLMHNCPDYAAIWLGITQVGCTVALINTNLTGDALVHSIRAAGSRQIIVAGPMLDSVRAIAGQLADGTNIWVHGDGDAGDLLQIDSDITTPGSTWPEIAEARKPAMTDRALLIYTSGTTGLPKAANVSHARILEWSYWFAGMMDARPDDRLYDCLPMYHSTGGVVAIGSMLVSGASIMIRERFSASRFWNDVDRGECTVFQYIGELCRYLLQSAPHPLETSHRLRLCCGNGLRGDVWEGVRRRFRIPHVLEFYASTEGNVSLYNCEERPGAIGRIPPFLAHRFPLELIRTDVDTSESLRDSAGFCIRCAADEPGEAISPINTDSASPARHFDGYTDPEASARKVLRDVFAKGDLWFRTGDLMRKDRAGYFYFVDRLGDTFRWKGENVSTDEVASVLAACPGVIQAVVYGVAIPGTEGRVGMAAITTDVGFNFVVLRQHLCERLPDYARPLFIRRCRDIPTTGTFKLTKGTLAHEGLTPSVHCDTVWFDDLKSQAFVNCDVALIRAICGGTISL